MAKPLRLAFMGTPDFTVLSLEALIASGHDVVCVYTQPPRPKGRGQQLQKSAVHLYAEKYGIEVRTPPNFKNPDDVADFAALDLDAAIVAGYGMILPKPILKAPRHGCINIHPSLLPRWRGVAPVQFAILNGDEKSGVCVMMLDEKMDTGPIIAREEFALEPRETSMTLNEKVWPMGAKMLAEVIGALARDGGLDAAPQALDGATYTRFLTKEDGHIDWKNSAETIDRQIRALNPWPGTWCLDEKGHRFKILAARLSPDGTSRSPGTIVAAQSGVACGGGTVLLIETLQPENKKPMDFAAALHGNIIADGQTLS